MKSLVSGVTGAAPMWRKIIAEYLKDKPAVNFVVPSDVITAEVDLISGYRAHDGFPFRTEYFIKGTEPAESVSDPVHQKLKLCRGQTKLATLVDIARGDYDEKEYIIFKENDPFAGPGEENRWQKGIDAWVAKQSDERYRPPTEYCDTMDQVHVRLEPGDQSQVNPSFNVKVEPTTVNDVTRIEIFVNGESKKILTSYPYELSLNLSDGKYTIKAEVTDSRGNRGSAESRIGVNMSWDWQPSPTPVPTTIPTLAPTP